MALGQDAGMHIQAVAFDVNGTLVKILAEDGSEDIFRAAAHFLTYRGIDMCQARSGLAGGSGSGAGGVGMPPPRGSPAVSLPARPV